MFQLRWRWPILALLLTGIGYGSKYYTIGGIEHLRLQPRQASGEANLINAWQAGLPSATPFNPQSSAPNFADVQVPSGWRGQPSADPSAVPGQAAFSSMPSQASSSFATAHATPIPAPPDFVPASKPQSAYSPLTNSFEHASPNPLLQDSAQRTASLGRLSTARVGTAVGNSPEAARADNNANYVYARKPNTIRVASFQTNGLDRNNLEQREVLDIYAHIISQFDVVALQGILVDQQSNLVAVVEQMNRSGRQFEYLIGPAVGRSYPQQIFAFVYDTTTLETDQRELYTVEDPQDLVSYEPLVAWFQCKNAQQVPAFKFSLVNTLIDSNLASREIALLPKLIAAIENDGRAEDDWIIAGHLAGHVRSVLDLDSNVRLALPVKATNIFGTQASDTIFFSAMATVEFSENSGVYDFLRLFNLSIEQASLVSQHLPVWAEFSTMEGVHP
ncbi:MAG: hypothetical protein NXI32_12635 [bacterium]|nr:hypothetical protein [bacterium]